MIKENSHSSGSTTENMLDYIKPIARKKRNVLIIHTGTIDLANVVNSMRKVKKLFRCIRDPGIVGRLHRSVVMEIKNQKCINMKIKKYSEDKGFIFVGK